MDEKEQQSKRLDPTFYLRGATDVAQDLIGKILVRRLDTGGLLRFRITETEAYCGEEDTACHAHKGKTPRTAVMYRAGGCAYVYLCYGIHYLLNIVTAHEGRPEAVLLRGAVLLDCADGSSPLKPAKVLNGPGKLTKAAQIDGSLNGADIAGGGAVLLDCADSPSPFKLAKALNGPGKLTKAAQIDSGLNGADIAGGGALWVEDDGYRAAFVQTARVGIDYATEEYKNKPWRFVLSHD